MDPAVVYVLSQAIEVAQTFQGALFFSAISIYALTSVSDRIERAYRWRKKMRYLGKAVCTAKMSKSHKSIRGEGEFHSAHRLPGQRFSNPELVELLLEGGVRTMIPVSRRVHKKIKVGAEVPCWLARVARRRAVSEVP
jgi:hypothetical protein